jgi:hypothetical protein
MAKRIQPINRDAGFATEFLHV